MDLYQRVNWKYDNTFSCYFFVQKPRVDVFRIYFFQWFAGVYVMFPQPLVFEIFLLLPIFPPKLVTLSLLLFFLGPPATTWYLQMARFQTYVKSVKRFLLPSQCQISFKEGDHPWLQTIIVQEQSETSAVRLSIKVVASFTLKLSSSVSCSHYRSKTVLHIWTGGGRALVCLYLFVCTLLCPPSHLYVCNNKLEHVKKLQFWVVHRNTHSDSPSTL